jgi:hypothetical protein
MDLAGLPELVGLMALAELVEEPILWTAGMQRPLQLKTDGRKCIIT